QGYIKGGHDQIFTLSIDGGTPKQLTTTTFDHGAPVWSKNDQTLYFSANFNPDEAFEPANSEVYTLNIATAEVSPLTTRYGPDGSPAVSPDGKMIAYTGNDDKLQGYQITELYVMNTDGSNSKLLSGNFDRDIANAQWSNDGKGLYFQYDTEGATKIGHITLDGKVTTLVEGLGGLSLGRPYNAGDFTVSKNSRFAYTLGNTQHPSDLGVADKKVSKRLTFVNDDLFSFRGLGKTEEIWWKSSYDQKDIQGWVVTPPNFDPSKKYPLVLRCFCSVRKEGLKQKGE
ncbi:S9 family peptidase, partial [Maribacter arcticus]|nr:S9 family peptidase [Maribacter arcticus]